MGSSSSSGSSSKKSAEIYGDWVDGEKKYKESDIKVKYLKWRDVPLTNKAKEIGSIFLRTLTLGIAEIWCEGKDLSHDFIVVGTDKGFNYVLEWLGGNKLRPGYYNILNRNHYDKKYDYTPKKNMRLSDLRNIMNNNPGEGDCKDHVRLWWKIIQDKY